MLQYCAKKKQTIILPIVAIIPIYGQYLKNVSVGMIDRRHSCRAIALTAAINRCIVELQANNRFRLKIYRLSQIYIYRFSSTVYHVH